VLEDLASLKFILADRNQRLNLKEAKVVLEKLSKFHAISAVLHKTNANLMARQMVSAIDGTEMTPLAFFFATSLEATLTTIRNTPELQQYAPMLENYDIVEKERNVFTRSESDKFHVLNHGDLWLNNIFFEYDKDGDPTDSLLVSIWEKKLSATEKNIFDLDRIFYFAQ
jgi:Ecdysteroid kinase-like family